MSDVKVTPTQADFSRAVIAETIDRARLQGWRECREAVAKVTHENGPVVIDMVGEDLVWSPLNYVAWTPFLPPSGTHGNGPGRRVGNLTPSTPETSHVE